MGKIKNWEKKEDSKNTERWGNYYKKKTTAYGKPSAKAMVRLYSGPQTDEWVLHIQRFRGDYKDIHKSGSKTKLKKFATKWMRKHPNG